MFFNGRPKRVRESPRHEIGYVRSTKLTLTNNPTYEPTTTLWVFYRNKNLFSAGAAARLRLSLRSIQMIRLNSVARAVAPGGRL